MDPEVSKQKKRRVNHIWLIKAISKDFGG
jgi:hypothetical protein